MKKKIRILPLLMLLSLLLSSCGTEQAGQRASINDAVSYAEWTNSLCAETPAAVDEIPEYSGSPYVEIHDNEPDFEAADFTLSAYEYYSDLDSLGRCGVTFANVCQDTMPTEKRGDIGHVKPTGWHTVKYADIIEDVYLYNRCHLLGYQLTGENDNTSNLITGTRYMNVEGMLPFENEIAEYVKETGNHVLYRVTPIFDGDDLVARGVEMEAESVEDSGSGVKFHVFCYNVQPGIAIDYSTGDSREDDSNLFGNETFAQQTATVASRSDQEENESAGSSESVVYVLNTNSKKFHYSTCSSVEKMNDANKEYSTQSREEIIAEGYTPCGNCKP